MKEKALEAIEESFEKFKHMIARNENDEIYRKFLGLQTRIIELINNSDENSVFLKNVVKDAAYIIITLEHLKDLAWAATMCSHNHEKLKNMTDKIDDIIVKDGCKILGIEDKELFESFYFW